MVKLDPLRVEMDLIESLQVSKREKKYPHKDRNEFILTSGIEKNEKQAGFYSFTVFFFFARRDSRISLYAEFPVSLSNYVALQQH